MRTLTHRASPNRSPLSTRHTAQGNAVVWVVVLVFLLGLTWWWTHRAPTPLPGQDALQPYAQTYKKATKGIENAQASEVERLQKMETEHAD